MWKTVVASLLLSLAFPMALADEPSVSPDELPDSFRVEKKDGKLFTPGFYPKNMYGVRMQEGYTLPQKLELDLHKARQHQVLARAWPSSRPADVPVIHLIADRQGNLLRSDILIPSQDPVADHEALKRLTAFFPLSEPPPPVLKDKRLQYFLTPHDSAYFLAYPIVGQIPTDPEHKLDDGSRNFRNPSCRLLDWNTVVHQRIRSQRWANPLPSHKRLQAQLLLIVYAKTGKILWHDLLIPSSDPTFDELAMEAGQSIRGKDWGSLVSCSPTNILPIVIQLDSGTFSAQASHLRYDFAAPPYLRP